MSELGNETNDVAQQGSDTAKGMGKSVAKKAGRAAKNLTRKATGAAVKGVAKLAVKAGQAFVTAIAKILALLGPIGIIVLVVFFVFSACFVFLLDERGSNESNDLNPDIENPSYVESTSGITKAVALTEPQAVIDAYYKYLACSSYTKAFGGKMWEFQNPDNTSDFAGLRDYNKVEENFYLSDDFIRTLDELLHDGQFFYPEQVIKPVYGQQLTLADKNGKEAKYYTSRLPFDSPDGKVMKDPEHVKSFTDMLGAGTELTAPGTTGNEPQLLPQSQVPPAATEGGEAKENHYEMKDRNVVFGDKLATESGLWDYGFGSVLQYQPEQKTSFISCNYDSLDVDFDYEQLEESKDGSLHWVHYHGEAKSMPISGSLDAVKTASQKLCDEKSSETVRWHYHLPTNAAAIADNGTAWSTGAEPNAAAEQAYRSAYGRAFTNSHIDMKIINPWDADIDRTVFKDATLKANYGNVGGGLYPLKIPLVSHAATFSGNIHYTITPAGAEGCIEEVSELSVNSTPEIDQREPVQTIQVAGGCGAVKLTAHRTGTATTQRPLVEETTSPWGFEYLEDFSDYYQGFIPDDFLKDRDFFVRTGLSAPENSDNKNAYKQNLSFLMDLGLLRLYTGNVQLGSVGSVDMAGLSDPSSDLYILSHVIAAEAGPNKLDELMVGSVFVNRVASDRYPNSFQGVLQAKNQYACYTDGNYQKAKPTESEIASAVQVLTGQFAIPENITGQSAKVQGTVYKMVDNPPGFYDHYYCTMQAQAISTVDRFGRPAPDAAQLESIVATLENKAPEDAENTASAIDLSTTAFIGDSLTLGLDQTADLTGKGALVIAEVGNSISQAKRACENSTTLSPSTKTVYLLIGTNSCGLADSVFETQYRELLSAIETKTGGAKVILISLPPVLDGKSNATNVYINAKNKVISKIATDLGLKVLDIHTALLRDGQLNLSYSADGLHLNSEGYNLWFTKLKAGLTSSGIGQNPSGSFELKDGNGAPVRSRYTLYDISQFDVLTATNMQTRLTQPDSGFMAALKGILDDFYDALDQIGNFFKGIGKVFSPPESVYSFKFARPYNGHDVKSVVYHSIAFTNQIWFSTAESIADNAANEKDGLTFLFVGKNNLLGLGTVGTAGTRQIPGVGTTVEGMISPTKAYYKPLTPYSSSTGYMELSTPVGTKVLAVADGTVVSVCDDASNANGKHVIISATISGDTYKVTYGYLDTIATAEGRSVKQGDLMGTTGKKSNGTAAFLLSVTKNGQLVNPTSIFYQMTSASGPGLAGNLNNSDGTVNQDLIAALEKELTAYVNAGGGMYHKRPLNTLQYKQCTWWAFGRGFQYIQSIGLPFTNGEYRAAIHGNGGQYADNNAAAGLFNYGSTPKANSLVCYEGLPYGHVAYVEAVDNVNKVYYESEAGSGNWWGGINKRPFGFTSGYSKGVFIYLDEPLK